jgi:hypothetical protein
MDLSRMIEKPMLLMNMLLMLLIVAALHIQACATAPVPGSNPQVNPVSSWFVPNTLYDDAVTLTDDATLACNVGAAKEYNRNMIVCNNPQAFVNQLPTVPMTTITPAQEIAILTAVCRVSNYTPDLPMTVAPGPQAVCMAPVPAPTPAQANMRRHYQQTHGQ